MKAEEIEDMKRENILLRMHKRRLENDLEKLQGMVKHLMLKEVADGKEAEHCTGASGNNP